MYEENLADQLRQGGLTEEEISSVLEAYKTGDQAQVDAAYETINAAHQEEYEKIMRDSLAESGMSEEDINKVIEAAREGGTDKANEVLAQINEERAKAYEEQLTNQLKENGMTDEEIAKVLEAYKTGDQDKLNDVLKTISDEHTEQALNDMRESLSESGLTDEEINQVIEAAREGGSDGANQALESISEAHKTAYEEQLRKQLEANGVDADTINRMVEAYRNGDQAEMDSIYAEINAKKEAQIRAQLSDTFSGDTLDALVKAYMTGDQDTINSIYAELAKQREDEFIQQLIDNGITNEQDLEDAREAYRTGKQDELEAVMDEIATSYISFEPNENGDVVLPPSFRIEAVLSQFGSSSRFSGSVISDVQSGETNYDNFQSVFDSIAQEVASGNFAKYDKQGVNEFGYVYFPGEAYSNHISNYYSFLDTLKQDLETLRATLIKAEGELVYYSSIETDIVGNMFDSAGNANVEFYQQLGNLGIVNFDPNVDARDNQSIVDFNNDLFGRLADYYDDKEFDEAKINPFDQELTDEQRRIAQENYERCATQIVLMLNQAAISGLVDLEHNYNGDEMSLQGFSMAQFNEHCRNADNSIRFDYGTSDDELMYRNLATIVYQGELLTSMDNVSHGGLDTELYRSFVNDAIAYTNNQNRYRSELTFTLDPSSFAYTVLQLSVQKEAFSPSGQWRYDRSSSTYQDIAAAYNPSCGLDYDSYMDQNGMGMPRTELGNDVVEIFAKIVNNKTSEERLDRSLVNGSNFEEAFYLSYQYNEIISPSYQQYATDLYNFQAAVGNNGSYTPLDLSSQTDSDELIARMRTDARFSDMFDANGNLTGEYANINGISNDERRAILQKEMTEAILLTRSEMWAERNLNIIEQSQLFNMFVKPRYQGVTNPSDLTEMDMTGRNLYLDFANGKTTIGDYLEHELVTASEFANRPDLQSKYTDYKSYVYAFDNASGSRYNDVVRYLTANPVTRVDSETGQTITVDFRTTYNNFNDGVINLELNASQVTLANNQFHEQLLASLAQESGSNIIMEILEAIGESYAATTYMDQATSLYTLINPEYGQYCYAQASACNQRASDHFTEAGYFSDMKHRYSDLQIVTTNIINDLQYEAVNFTSKYSFFDQYINEFKNYYETCKLNVSYDIDENGNPITTYEWVNAENGERLEVSDEQLALMFLMAERDGKSIDWNSVDSSISKYGQNIQYLEKDAATNYDAVLNYLAFAHTANEENTDGFMQQMLNFSNLGFDTEARRRADEYTSDFFAKNISKLLNIEIDDNWDLINQFGGLGFILASTEWVSENVLFPALHGIDGFFKSIGYALGDTIMVACGREDEIDFSVSLNDQTWAYVIDNYKSSGGFQLANFYVTQAMISIGNQAIPIALNFIPGVGQYLSMGALFLSAYGNTLHTTLNEFLHDGREETGAGNAILYALMDGAAEMLMEKFVGRMPGLSNAVSVGLKGFAQDIIGEMVEESLQELLGPLFKDIATFDIFRAMGNGEFDRYVCDFLGNKVDLEAIRDAAIIAAISSGVMNGVRNGPAIVESLYLTNGQSSSLIQLLQLQSSAMAQAGFTSDQIQQQYQTNLQAAINNSGNLNSIAQTFLNSPSFEAEFKSWKDGLGKNDPRSEFNIEDFANMRAIQSLSFDTTELTMQANINNIRINQLQTILSTDNKNTLRNELSQLNELLRQNPNDTNLIERIKMLNEFLSTSDHSYLIEQINTLNSQNVEINEQINQMKANAQIAINTNTQTITELKNKLTDLQSRQETVTTEEELTSLREQIQQTQTQIQQLTVENQIITFGLTDNVAVLEALIENNNTALETLRKQVTNEGLSENIIDIINEQIQIDEQQQVELTERLEVARTTLAESLVVEEANTLRGIAALESINKTDLDKLSPNERAKYEQLQTTINQLKEKLNTIQTELTKLEGQGVKVEGRITLEDVVKANQEIAEQLDNRISLQVDQFLEGRPDIGVPEGVISQIEGQTIQENLGGSAIETVSQTQITTFTQNMTLVISPLIMNIGFNIGNLISTDGQVMHNFGPSCGRIISLIEGQNQELTLKFNSTPETDVDVRSDLQQQINTNNNAISDLTALMAQFSIDENSPLTALMEQMNFNKMQLEEMRRKSELQTSEIEAHEISYMDMLQEIMWSIKEIELGEQTKTSKYETLTHAIEEISKQTGWPLSTLTSQLVHVDSIDGLTVGPAGVSIGSILSYYRFMSEENIQSILDGSQSYISSIDTIRDFIKNSDFDASELLKKEISNLSIDGKKMPIDLSLENLLSFFEGRQKRLEYDVIQSRNGSYDRSRTITSLKGLTEVETSKLLSLIDLVEIVKSTRLRGKTFNAAMSDIVSSFYGIEYLLGNGVEAQKFVSNPSSLTTNETLLLATSVIGSLKQKMINAGVGLITTATTSDGKIVKVYGTDLQFAQKLLNRFESLYEGLPGIAKASVSEISLFADFRNPADDYWAVKYEGSIKRGFISAATGGGGTVNVWNIAPNPGHLAIDTLCHEYGHNIDSYISKVMFNQYDMWTNMNSEWQQARDADGRRVSAYGEKAIVEDFAESFMRFITDHNAFVRECPNRAALLQRMVVELGQKVFGANYDIQSDFDMTLDLSKVVSAVQNITQNTSTTVNQTTNLSETVTQVGLNPATISSPTIGIDTQAIVTQVNTILTSSTVSMDTMIRQLSQFSVEEIKVLLENNSLISTDTMLGKVLQMGMKFYEEGHETAETKYKDFYENFRDHGFQHALAVAEYAQNLISQGCNVDAEVTLLAALMHDLGMTGESGTQGYVNLKDAKVAKELRNAFKKFEQFFSEDQKARIEELQLKTRDSISMEILHEIANWDIEVVNEDGSISTKKFINNFKFSMKIARGMHPLNSAMYIIENYFGELGSEQATRAAILAMSHSKSTSGVTSFININHWNQCITILESSLQERFESTSIEFQERYSALESLREEIRDPKNLTRLINEAFLVREGDAMSDVVMFGNRILMQNGVFSVVEYLTEATRENFKVLETLELEAQTYTDMRSDGTEVTNETSKSIHAGELNTKYSSEVTLDADGNFDVYRGEVTLKNPYAVPIATWEYSIKERLGELNTYTNMSERSFTIWLPSDVSQDVIEHYQKQILSWVEDQKAHFPSDMDQETRRSQEAFYDSIGIEFIDSRVYDNTSLSIDQKLAITETTRLLSTPGTTMGSVLNLLSNYSVEQIQAILQNNSLISTDTMLGRVLQMGMKFYEEGHETAETKYKDFYENFRDHGFQHALAVAEYAQNLISQGCNVDAEVTLLAALMHDLGMTGESGTQGYVNLKDAKVAKELRNAFKKFEQFFSEDQKARIEELQLKTRDSISMEILHEIANWDIEVVNEDGSISTKKFINNFKFSMKIARGMHPLNSAMYIIENYFGELGSEQATRAAILAMSHSKSTSGVTSFININHWNQCITILESSLQERFESTSIEFQERYSALESLREEIRDPKNLTRLINEAFLVREGDAMSDVVMFGNRILMQNGVFSVVEYLTEATRENFKVLETLELEAQTYTDMRSDGTEVTNETSKSIHAGELNTKYSSEVTLDADGNFDVYRGEVTLKNPYAVPIATWEYSIKERLGELNTYTNMSERSFTIWLPSDVSQDVIEHYQKQILSWVEDQKAHFPSDMDQETRRSQEAFYANIKVELRPSTETTIETITSSPTIGIDSQIETSQTESQISMPMPTTTTTSTEVVSETVMTVVQESLSTITELAKGDKEVSIAERIKMVDTVFAAIIDTNVDINSLGINRTNISYVIEALNLSQQEELFDSLYARLSQGQVFDNETFKAIFTSSVFNADNAFARTYLHHFLETLTPGDSTLADAVSKIYENARKSTTEQKLSDLYSYCDHTEAHTLQVAFLTLKALNAISEEARITGNKQYLTMTEANYKEMFVAGLLHDLGMAAGAIIDDVELLQGVNGYLRVVNDIVEIVADDLDFSSKDLAGTIRENHTLNSALAILGLREQLERAGLNADILAMICFSHSKSNSGVGILTEGNDWALCIEKIQRAVDTHNKHQGATQLTFNLENIGRYDGTTVETTSLQKIKKPKTLSKAIVKKVIYSQDFIEAMTTKAFALRVGDAFVSKAKITLETPVTWVYDGKTYTASEAILTQSGYYMLYDKSNSVLSTKFNNSAESETADIGAFAYFTLVNGELVPCMLRTETISVNGQSVEIKRFEVLDEYVKENGAFVFTESDNPFMSTMGPLTAKAKIDGKDVKLSITEQGYYLDKQSDGIKLYYQRDSDNNYTLKYSVKEKDGIVSYYSYDSENNETILSVDNIESLVGKIVTVSTGQFLAGESNVEYEFYRGTITNKTTLETLNGLIAEMIIKNPESFIYNALDKGINERLGELKGASNIERIVNIRFDSSQGFDEMFEVIEIDGKKCIAAKNRAGEIYLESIVKFNKPNLFNGVKVLFEGYSVEEVITVDHSQSSINGDTTIETVPSSSTSTQAIPSVIEITQTDQIEETIARLDTMSREELIDLYIESDSPVLLQEIESRLETYKITVPGLKQYLHTLGVKTGLLTETQIKSIENSYKIISKWKQEIANLEHFATMYGSAVKAQIPKYRQWIAEEYLKIQHTIDSVRTKTGYKGYISYQEFLNNNEQARKTWEATLTESEWNLLKGYKSESDYAPGSYSAVNTLLRMSVDQIIDYDKKTITFRHTGNRFETHTFDEIERITGLTISEYIQSISSAAVKLDEIIRRSPLAENMTLYRGISKEALLSDFGIDIYTDSESEILAKLNGIYSDKGFMSTSVTMNSEFFDNSEVVLILNCAQGTPAIDLSTINADEQEVVLSYGQKFKVEKVEKVDVDGKTKVYIYLATI